ncbi:MAG: S41 family peptidase [Bacteroidota bacterium]
MKTLSQWLFLAFISFGTVYTLCGQEVSDQLTFTFSQEDASIHPRIKGIWKSIGGGYIWDARGDSFHLYSYTENYCFRERNDYQERLMIFEAQFLFKGDTLRIFPTDYGEQTAQLNTPVDFIRVGELPNCLSREKLQKAGTDMIFAIFLENMEENYAFSKERKLDWEKIRMRYIDRVKDTTNQDSLFQWMGEIVQSTKDHHTKIFNKSGQKIQYTYTPSSDIVYDAYSHQSKVKDLNTFFGQFFESNYRHISDTLLQGKGKKVLNGKIEWGRLNQGIGYIHIHQFSGFVKDPIPRKQQVDSIRYYMTEIIDNLRDTDAIIVDVSFNFGGFDAAALTIAGHFTPEKLWAYSNQVFHQNSYQTVMETYVYPSTAEPYLKPVYLLTTDITRSAAEIFSMAMRAIPHVKHVGKPTLGILSGMLNKSLGPFHTTCSYQRFLTPDGKFFEATGIPPEMELEIFNRPDVMKGHLEAVRELIRIIE